MVFPADPAGMVTVGVTDLAVAGASHLADAGIVLPADPAGMVTVGVTNLTDVTPVNVIGVPECSSAVSWGDRLSPGVWCREKTLIRRNSDVRLIIQYDVIRLTRAVQCQLMVQLVHLRPCCLI